MDSLAHPAQCQTELIQVSQHAWKIQTNTTTALAGDACGVQLAIPLKSRRLNRHGQIEEGQSLPVAQSDARDFTPPMTDNFSRGQPVIEGMAVRAAVLLPKIIGLLANLCIEIVMIQSLSIFADIHEFPPG
jgi:hypothetical protein